jgi:adenylate cyclase
MSLDTDIFTAVSDIVDTKIDSRKGRVIPRTEDVALKDGGVELKAVFLYADLMESTALAANHPRDTTARVIRGFLATVTKVLLHHGGKIRSFDGDRVMAIFIDYGAASRAAKSALQIRWALSELLEPVVYLKFKSIQTSGWTPKAGIGIDIGDALLVRGGVRMNSDLVSIGDAPNIAAKLSEIRSKDGARAFITDRMWDAMNWDSCFKGTYDSGTYEHMWSDPESTDLGGRSEMVRSSGWYWTIS